MSPFRPFTAAAQLEVVLPRHCLRHDERVGVVDQAHDSRLELVRVPHLRALQPQATFPVRFP
jgi:hypothetical protein